MRPAGQDDRRHHEAGTLAARQLPNASMGEMRTAESHRSEEVDMMEANARTDLHGSPFHGSDGPVAVEDARYLNPLSTAFLVMPL